MASAASKDNNYYAILEVDASADGAAIAASYRRLARLKHPDKNPGNAEEATADFQKLQEAYSTLSDPQKRQAYDGQHRPPIPSQPFATFVRHPGRKANKRNFEFYAQHINPTWTNNNYYHYECGKATAQTKTNPELESQIRQVRKEIKQDDAAISQRERRREEVSKEIRTVWTKISEMNEKLQEMEQEKHHLAAHPGGRGWFDDIFGPMPTVAEVEVARQSHAELCTKQQVLQGRIKDSERELEALTEESRDVVRDMQELTEHREELSERLNVLCKAWRMECSGDTQENPETEGCNDWCAWDGSESVAEAEEPEPKTPWWEKEDQEGEEGEEGQKDSVYPGWEATSSDDGPEFSSAGSLGTGFGSRSRSGSEGKPEPDEVLIDVIDVENDENKASEETSTAGYGDAKTRTSSGPGKPTTDGPNTASGFWANDSNDDLIDVGRDTGWGVRDHDGDTKSTAHLNPAVNCWWPPTIVSEETTRRWGERDWEWRQAACREW